MTKSSIDCDQNFESTETPFTSPGTDLPLLQAGILVPNLRPEFLTLDSERLKIFFGIVYFPNTRRPLVTVFCIFLVA